MHKKHLRLYIIERFLYTVKGTERMRLLGHSRGKIWRVCLPGAMFFSLKGLEPARGEYK